MNQLEVMKNTGIDVMKNAGAELTVAQELVGQLLKTPHYSKMGQDGIFAIIQKARSIDYDVMDALNGGMFYVGGKVELAGNAMNSLIRSKGHSIKKDPGSNAERCILHGKRADNGDTMTATFSMAEAKRAGLGGTSWTKYPEDMMFWRALSRLARQLFPDVIKGCYVQGEIQEDWNKPVEPKKEYIQATIEIPQVTQEQYISGGEAEELLALIAQTEEKFQSDVKDYFDRQGIKEDLSNFPYAMLERITNAAKTKKKQVANV